MRRRPRRGWFVQSRASRVSAIRAVNSPWRALAARSGSSASRFLASADVEGFLGHGDFAGGGLDFLIDFGQLHRRGLRLGRFLGDRFSCRGHLLLELAGARLELPGRLGQRLVVGQLGGGSQGLVAGFGQGLENVFLGRDLLDGRGQGGRRVVRRFLRLRPASSGRLRARPRLSKTRRRPCSARRWPFRWPVSAPATRRPASAVRLRRGHGAVCAAFGVKRRLALAVRWFADRRAVSASSRKKALVSNFIRTSSSANSASSFDSTLGLSLCCMSSGCTRPRPIMWAHRRLAQLRLNAPLVPSVATAARLRAAAVLGNRTHVLGRRDDVLLFLAEHRLAGRHAAAAVSAPRACRASPVKTDL